MDLTQVINVLKGMGSLLPYAQDIAEIAPAVTTTVKFVEDTINNWKASGVAMPDDQWNSVKQQIDDLKQDPAWLTDAERGVAAPPPTTGS